MNDSSTSGPKDSGVSRKLPQSRAKSVTHSRNVSEPYATDVSRPSGLWSMIQKKCESRSLTSWAYRWCGAWARHAGESSRVAPSERNRRCSRRTPRRTGATGAPRAARPSARLRPPAALAPATAPSRRPSPGLRREGLSTAARSPFHSRRTPSARHQPHLSATPAASFTPHARVTVQAEPSPAAQLGACMFEAAASWNRPVHAVSTERRAG